MKALLGTEADCRSFCVRNKRIFVPWYSDADFLRLSAREQIEQFPHVLEMLDPIMLMWVNNLLLTRGLNLGVDIVLIVDDMVVTDISEIERYMFDQITKGVE